MFFYMLKPVTLQLTIQIGVQPFGDVVRHVQPPIKPIAVPILLSINCVHNSNGTSQFQPVYPVSMKSLDTTYLHILSAPIQPGLHLEGIKWLSAPAASFPAGTREFRDRVHRRSVEGLR